MHEKLEKAKEVIKNNWKPFAIGSTVTIVTFVVTRRLIASHTANLIIVETMNKIRPIGFWSKQTINTNIIKLYTGEQGRPGYYCHLAGRPEVGYPSQRAAAKVFGVTDREMSLHLNGKIPNIKGYILERPEV